MCQIEAFADPILLSHLCASSGIGIERSLAKSRPAALMLDVLRPKIVNAVLTSQIGSWQAYTVCLLITRRPRPQVRLLADPFSIFLDMSVNQESSL